MMITFSDKKDFDLKGLLDLFDQADWAKGRTETDTLEMLAHSDLVVSAWDGDILVGVGRVLSDYVYRASIWDVIVHRGYQGQDIGTQIIHQILHHPTLQRVELFWLCTRNKQAFYATLGFSDREQTGMVWDRRKQQGMPNAE